MATENTGDSVTALTAREVAEMPRLTADLAQFLWQLQPVTRGNCQAIVERLAQEARRETAQEIADAIEAQTHQIGVTHRVSEVLKIAADIARSFTEESSEPCPHIAQSFGHKMCMTCGATLEDQPLTIDRSVVERATPVLGLNVPPPAEPDDAEGSTDGDA